MKVCVAIDGRLHWMAGFALASLAACGGGHGRMDAAPDLTLTRVSADSSFAPGCNGAPQTGSLYANAEVEPFVGANPLTPANLVGVWQQDRWSNGGAQAMFTGVSFDGGASWTRPPPPPFSRCAGGTPANGGDYQRASDPWLSFAADGVAYQVALAFDGDTLQSGSRGAVLLSRSADGGMSWSAPLTLIADGADAFNDKETVSADPHDARYAYVVWDRIDAATHAPTYLARTVDGGASWEPAHAIYDPGPGSQTLGNQIAVLADGSLVDVFTQIDIAADGTLSATFAAIRSSDHGASWSAPSTVAESLGIGARDPQTGAPLRDGVDLTAIAVAPSGALYAVWQDARFSGGARDDIAFARSNDGGLSWSAPVAINGAPQAAAFTPSLSVLADGSVGVSYYDLRDDTADRNTLLASYWLTRSADGVNWSETRIAQAFDLDFAPRDGGPFLGDYEGLAGIGADFLAFFARANPSTANRSDVYARRLAPGSAAVVRARAAPLSPAAAAAGLNAARSAALERVLQQRLPGWAALRRRELPATGIPAAGR